MKSKPINYAKYIDHTLLKMDATEADIIKLCEEAKKYLFYSVCVNSCHVPLVAKMLIGSGVKICSVVGFPLGASLTLVKAFEAKMAIKAGADEIDMVMNVGWLKSGNIVAVVDDIKQVKHAARQAILKVILETCLLTNDEIKIACQICRELGVDFVKTSTGFSISGATEETVRLMRDVVGCEVGVKASAGIRNTKVAKAMIDAGATRLGSSSGISIITDQKEDNSHYY